MPINSEKASVCPNCGAPIQREYGKSAICEYCGSYIPVPKTERETKPKPAAPAVQAPAPAPVYVQRRPVCSAPLFKPSKEEELRRAEQEAREQAARRWRSLVISIVCFALFFLWVIAASKALSRNPFSPLASKTMMRVALCIAFVGYVALRVALRKL